MTQITRVPIGLQAFLGTQAQGKNPSELSDVVVPVLSIDQFLSIQQEFWQAAGFTPGTVNATETFVVPEGEVWVLNSAGFQHSGMTTGDTYTASVSISNHSTSILPLSSHPLGDPFYFEKRGSGGVWSGFNIDNVIAPAGSQIVFHITEAALTTNQNTKAYLRYLRLEV